ncbi:myosin XVB [Microcaecilia unicolor]|uniref:Myosin XVB n=1 Tax=Microcaecilia unicolor TaxID=1415580 RepID=A0A6P7Y9G9_9AMPH|nr:myosin XVB [Microcaecilia unicolor]
MKTQSLMRSIPIREIPFSKKEIFFQKIGQQENEVKASRSKILLPQGMSEMNKEKEEEEPEQNDNPEPVAKPETVSVPPPKPPVQKPVVPSKPKPKQEKTNLVKSLQPPSRPEPSQEIRNIIKMYQTRPAIEPQPLQPVRKPPNYLFKKNDPKDEALLRLGILDPTNGDIPPASSTKNNRSVTPTQSIREKQLPLLNIFATHPQPPGISSTSPTPPPPPPPPPTLAPTHPPSSIPPPPDSQAPVLQETDLRDCARLMPDDGNIKSFLCKLTASVYFSYANINWKIFLRKEVFYPREKFTQPYCLNLLCEQIMRDTYSDSCFRVSKEEKRKMKDLLMEFQVRTDARSIKDEGLKKRIVMTARDNWANYFSRFFPVTGENGSDVQLLGVSHRGIRLLKVVKASGLSPVHLKILCSYSYADMLSLAVKAPHILEFSLRNEQLILHSPKARQLKAIVDVFLEELRKDSNYVIALRSYITDDKSILQFKKGDLIKLLPMDGLDSGWQFGSVDGRSGLFPSNIVQAAAAPDYLSHQMNRNDGHKKSIGTPPVPTSVKESPTPSEASEVTNTEVSADANQYTMVEFAMKYFREALIMLGWKGMSAERKNPSILVQHTKVPIQESLIYYTDPELNEAAPHSFMSLMRFMGDQSSPKSSKEVDHVYHILQLCKEKENLRDEIYCQVIKQITENPKQESCSRGWLLFDLLCGFFLPSSTLLPYITKYLQEISSSPGSGCQDLANACQKNLRQTTLYGGRCHLPFTVEMEALLKGNHTRRILIKLPGNIDYGTKIKTFTVGAEVLKEFCEQVGVYEPEEIHEFSIFANKSNGEVIRPIRAEEYVHDFLLDDNSVTLELRRITWKLPLHFENDIFTDMHYYQTCQTYLNGKMLLQNQSMKQVGTLAALQLWAKGLASAPSKEDLLKSIPVPLQNANLQTIGQHVNEDLRLMQKLTPREAKIHFIETVMQFAFFDYNIYSVKRISEQGVPSPCLLGVNQQQIIVADSVSQKLYCSIPLVEVQTMRTLRPMDSATLQGVEINYGSPDNPKTMWFELEQAKEVYHTIALIMQELDSGSHV